MEKALSQLTLGVHLHDEATFANFYPGSNVEIVEALKQTVLGQGERFIYLCSARGQGISHLLQACCHSAHQRGLSSVYFPLAALRTCSSEVLHGFENLDLVCIDDLQQIAKLPTWEEAIFHLYNRIHTLGGKLIMAGNDLPKALHLQLPDLVSRLTGGVIYQLHPLNDDEKLTVLQMRATRRGIKITEEVGRFILNHCPRHMSTLFAALEILDKASLAAHRRLTIPFVKEILQI